MTAQVGTGVADDVEVLYRDGIVARRGALTKDVVLEMAEDVEHAFRDARARPGGVVGRGPNRFYSEIHPEQLRGFVELATNPWVAAVCERVLGPDYQIVEVGFDVPLPGAKVQPWHRDFPSFQGRDGRRLTSLAFNVTLVDTTEDMGPLEIAPGTQWDDAPDFDHGMFPGPAWHARYAELATRKMPSIGDVSARSALTIHRGTANHSDKARPVLVLGVDAPGAGNAGQHDMAVTSGFLDSLPQGLRPHLVCPVVNELQPIEQKHTIEGLVMG
jgi:ectoine hydroxylase-related dioxygenase (phytanoyl-CoA dioxygenase family)